MTEKDLDIAIEKCERIMEFDTRTLKNPESENGWIFEKVYELLKYLRQFQFATDTNVATTDTISRAAAINAICEDGTRIERQGWYSMTMVERKQRDVDILENLPSAQPEPEEFEWCHTCREYDQEKHCCHRWTKVIRKTVDDMKAAQPGWIPWDSGRFPEESGTYTVTAYDGAAKRVTYAKYQKRLKRWELTGARAYWRVLAWMPHIEPWEGDANG